MSKFIELASLLTRYKMFSPASQLDEQFKSVVSTGLKVATMATARSLIKESRKVLTRQTSGRNGKKRAWYLKKKVSSNQLALVNFRLTHVGR